MTSIEIYWQDLSKEKQHELLELFDGDNHNWDVFPLATLDIEDEEQIAVFCHPCFP